MAAKYRYQWYQQIYERTPEILEEARQYGEELGLDKLNAEFGLYPGSSARPGNLPDYVLNEIVEANRGLNGGGPPPCRRWTAQ